MDNLREKADALGVLCCTLFGTGLTDFRVQYWVECFPLPVILYSLVEAELKRRRAPAMTGMQIAAFAENVMIRRLQEEVVKSRAA